MKRPNGETGIRADFKNLFFGMRVRISLWALLMSTSTFAADPTIPCRVIINHDIPATIQYEAMEAVCTYIRKNNGFDPRAQNVIEVQIIKYCDGWINGIATPLNDTTNEIITDPAPFFLHKTWWFKSKETDTMWDLFHFGPMPEPEQVRKMPKCVWHDYWLDGSSEWLK